MSKFQVHFDQPLKGANHGSQSAERAALVESATAAPAPSAVDFTWVGDMLHMLDQRLLDLEGSRQRVLNELQMVAVDLAILATEKLLFSKIDRDEFPCATIIQELIQQLPTSGAIRVALHPKDLEQLQTELHDAAIANDADQSAADEAPRVDPKQQLFQRLELVSDPANPRGHFEIDSGEGVFFYDVATQLTDIRRVLMESLNESETERRTTGQQSGGVRRFPDRRSVG